MVFEKGNSSTHCLPREDSPLLPKYSSSEPLSSLAKTFGNILIAIVGAGVLGLPYTFMRTGWVAGIIMLGVVAGLTYYCMMLLVWTKRKLESEGINKIGSFGDLGYIVCGTMGKATVDAMIVLSQAGFCVSYLIFIGNSLSSVISKPEPMVNYLQFPTTKGFLGEYRILGIAAKTIFIWAIFPFQLGMNAIRTLTHLAPFSIFADVVDIAAMAVVMVEDVLTFLHNSPHLEAFTNLGIVPYGVGVAIYAFEGIGMVLPLEAEADKKHKFGRVLGLALIFITLTYGVFGVLGYFAFGSETRDIITLNLGKNFVTDIVQLALCINLFFTFPLMMNPVHEVVESRFNGGQYSFLLRSLVVLLTTIVALLVPNFADFLSLVGSSVCCALGFILPATFHLLACRKDSSLVQVLADALIIGFGVLFAVSGTLTSVKQIFWPSGQY
eukprot:Gb_13083 [translate_table: standard]